MPQVTLRVTGGFKSSPEVEAHPLRPLLTAELTPILQQLFSQVIAVLVYGPSPHPAFHVLVECSHRHTCHRCPFISFSARNNFESKTKYVRAQPEQYSREVH